MSGQTAVVMRLHMMVVLRSALDSIGVHHCCCCYGWSSSVGCPCSGLLFVGIIQMCVVVQRRYVNELEHLGTQSPMLFQQSHQSQHSIGVFHRRLMRHCERLWLWDEGMDMEDMCRNCQAVVVAVDSHQKQHKVAQRRLLSAIHAMLFEAVFLLRRDVHQNLQLGLN